MSRTLLAHSEMTEEELEAVYAQAQKDLNFLGTLAASEFTLEELWKLENIRRGNRHYGWNILRCNQLYEIITRVWTRAPVFKLES